MLHLKTSFLYTLVYKVKLRFKLSLHLVCNPENSSTVLKNSFLFLNSLQKLQGHCNFCSSINALQLSFKQTRCSRACSLNTFVFHSVCDPFVQNLQGAVDSKLLDLGSWNFERMFTPNHVSRVTCYVSSVTCQVSGVKCHNIFFLFFFFHKVV